MDNWPYDRLGWWVYAIHCVSGHHPADQLEAQKCASDLNGNEGAMLERLDTFYSDTLRLLRAGSLVPSDAKLLLFRAKALRKWKFAPSATSSQRKEKALVGYLQRNEDAARITRVPYPYGELMREILSGWLPEPSKLGWDWTGKFGPGAVAEKWSIAQKAEHLQSWIDHGFLPHLDTWPDVPLTCDDASHIVARLHAVPKQYSKDRLITIEPGYASFAQAYVREALQCSIHSGPLKGSAMDLGWVDGQEKQRRLALKASRTGKLATLDLSDASDRISWDIVQQVFPAWVTALLDVSRTPYVALPERFRKEHPELRTQDRYLNRIFAGMGNGTTFTVETLFFSAFVKAYAFAHGLNGFVSTFGDDIICSSDVASMLVTENFEFFRVNKEKSFWGADALRESCGIFAYKGTDITVPKVDGFSNSWIGRSSLCDLHARLLASGESAFCRLAYLIAREGVLVNWPMSLPGFPSIDNCLVERSAEPPRRWNKYLQRWEYQVAVRKPALATYPTDWRTAKRFNAPDPSVWYTWSLLTKADSVESKPSLVIRGRNARRRWSYSIPIQGWQKASVEWVAPLPI